VPRALRDQLAIGGRLVIPVGEHRQQNLLRITRGEAEDNRELLGACVFVDLVGSDGWSS
jgi:protein-L-isoaspartate(D-aspartate) O-methyltransferase